MGMFSLSWIPRVRRIELSRRVTVLAMFCAADLDSYLCGLAELCGGNRGSFLRPKGRLPKES
jgi:hypothetical protein